MPVRVDLSYAVSGYRDLTELNIPWQERLLYPVSETDGLSQE